MDFFMWVCGTPVWIFQISVKPISSALIAALAYPDDTSSRTGAHTPVRIYSIDYFHYAQIFSRACFISGLYSSR
jgi:hypothetical protein